MWRAISDPTELERWFPAAADWTPAPGETFEAYGATDEVTEVNAPHRLAWTFAGDRYSFELAAQEGGCRLTFTTSSTTARSPRRQRRAGRPTCHGSSLISAAGTSPRARHTGRQKKFPNATPSASGSTPPLAVASWPLSVPVNNDLVSATRDHRDGAIVTSAVREFTRHDDRPLGQGSVK